VWDVLRLWLEGRLEISITRLFPWYKNVRVNTFHSHDFLVQSLLCSACITPLAGMPMWLEGYGLCFDGGVSDLQLLKGLARNGRADYSYTPDKHPLTPPYKRPNLSTP